MFDLERVSNSDFKNGNGTENLPFFKPKHTLVGCWLIYLPGRGGWGSPFPAGPKWTPQPLVFLQTIEAAHARGRSTAAAAAAAEGRALADFNVTL